MIRKYNPSLLGGVLKTQDDRRWISQERTARERRFMFARRVDRAGSDLELRVQLARTGMFLQGGRSLRYLG